MPYTLKNETKLPEKYTEHFAFAEEKLQELAELKKLADVDYKLDAAFLENTFFVCYPSGLQKPCGTEACSSDQGGRFYQTSSV